MNKEEKQPDQPAGQEQTFVNPIDKDKITETPHILPYAHTVGGAVIKPLDKGKIKGNAMAAMYEQTDMHLDQIREQIELLARQARKIQSRVQISEMIYQADVGFKPQIGHLYHLYQRKNGKHIVSMIGPKEWGKTPPFAFISSVKLLSDHTWEMVD